MANVLELRVTAKNVREYWEADTNRAPYLGEVFFKTRTQKGLKFSFLKGKQGLPVALVPANWNTDVLYRDRIGVTELSGKLPFFKEAYAVDEELRQDILTAKEEYAGQLFSQVFDDTNDLLDGANVAVERMRMQLLSQGTILIQANGVDKAYDYGFNSSTQSVTESTLWSASGATPFASVVARKKAYKKLTKKEAKYAVFGVDAYEKLANDSAVIDYFAKLPVPNLAPTDDEIKRYLEARLGLTIFVNDKEYLKARDFNGTPTPFYPVDKYTLLSTLDLGETIYGTTPESIDLTSGGALSVEVMPNNVTITTWRETDPVNVNVKVSEVVAPSCPAIDQIYIVKVL